MSASGQGNKGKISFGALGVVETIKDPAKEITTIEVRSPGPIELSDGYHTMSELYDHRITLYIALCRATHDMDHELETASKPADRVWRSRVHADGSTFEGWYILGIGKELGKQITYHLPVTTWDETNFAETLDRAPEWDNHTSKDVLLRLAAL